MQIIKTTIPSTKGNLAAEIHYPEIKTDRLAILCPGYLDSKDYKHLVGLAEELCKRGYTVVRFDPTGIWDSQGEMADYTMTQSLTDIKIVLEYMLAQRDFKFILLGGHSRGAEISILYAARDSRISQVLSIMPSSERLMAGPKYEAWKKTGVRISSRDLPEDKNQKREYRVPYAYTEDRKQYNVTKEVEQVKSPIILVAGELDDSVPAKYVKEIFDHANEPKRFIIMPEIGHGYRRDDEEIKIVNQAILSQLENLE